MTICKAPDDSSEVNGKAKTTIDKITDNVITTKLQDDDTMMGA